MRRTAFVASGLLALCAAVAAWAGGGTGDQNLNPWMLRSGANATGLVASVTAGNSNLTASPTTGAVVVNLSATPAITSLTSGAGAAATPSVNFATDTTTGFYRSAAGVIGFSSAGASVATLGASGLSLGGISQPQRLAQVTGIDLKATGQTTLYTVPAGKTLFLTGLYVRVTASDTFATPATVRAGLSPGFVGAVAATVLTGLSATGAFVDLTRASLIQVVSSFAAGSVLKLDVTVGAGATTLTGAVDVLGWLE